MDRVGWPEWLLRLFGRCLDRSWGVEGRDRDAKVASEALDVARGEESLVGDAEGRLGDLPAGQQIGDPVRPDSKGFGSFIQQI
jgi:hypothetical protein